MSNAWYYAEGETTHGPMTLGELASVLSIAPQASNVLVFGPGLDTWQRAADVSDVAASLVKPPDPKVEAPIKPLGETAATPVAPDRAEAKPKSVANPELTGIDGWLILLALEQVSQLLKYLAFCPAYFKQDYNLFQTSPLVAAGDALIHAACAALLLYTTYLFFSKSRRFPRFFAYQVVATALFWLFGFPMGNSIGSLHETFPYPPGIVLAITSGIYGSIWLLYVFRSRRVANTFTR